MQVCHQYLQGYIFTRYILVIFIIFIVGCQEKQLTIVAKLNQNWRILLKNNTPEESAYPLIQSGTSLMVRTDCEANSTFMEIDLRNGRVIWEYLDTVEKKPLYYNLKPIRKDDSYIFPMGKKTKAIDYRTGKIKWSIKWQGAPEQFLEAFGKYAVLQAVNNWEDRVSTINCFDIETGSVKFHYKMVWPDSTKMIARTPIMLTDSTVFFTSITQNVYNRQTSAQWHILNTNSKSIILEGQAYLDNKFGYGVTKQPILYKGHVLLMSYDQFICLDYNTGCEVWRTPFSRDMLTSTPLVVDNAIFCALEDGYLYKLNIEDGHILWKSKISGTPSRIEFCKGQLFLIGGGDGALYTIESSSGRLIRKMFAPNAAYHKNEFFRRFIGIDRDRLQILLFDGYNYRSYNLNEDGSISH